MIVRSLSLVSFRLHGSTVLPVDQYPCVLLEGPNASGKTSILEAVHLVATGIGFRSRRDSDFVQFGTSGYRVDIATDAPSQLAIRYAAPGPREGFMDEARVPRWSDLVGRLRIVCLRPDDLALVEGAPEARRRFLDVMLSQKNRVYFDALRRFRRAWKQLGFAAAGPERLAGAFRAQAEKEMPLLFAARAAACRQIQESVRRMMSGMHFAGEFEVEYRPALPKGVEPGDWVGGAAACMREGKRLEAAGSPNPFGPTRDEVSLKLNGAPLRTFGSQGQKRISSMILRLSEAEVLGEDGAKPVIMADDVMGELDDQRRGSFLDLISGVGGQVWIAGTDVKNYEERWKKRVKFDIKSGSLQGAETH